MIRSDIVTPLLGILLSRPLIDHCFLSREDTRCRLSPATSVMAGFRDMGFPLIRLLELLHVVLTAPSGYRGVVSTAAMPECR